MWFSHGRTFGLHTSYTLLKGVVNDLPPSLHPQPRDCEIGVRPRLDIISICARSPRTLRNSAAGRGFAWERQIHKFRTEFMTIDSYESAVLCMKSALSPEVPEQSYLLQV